MPSADRYFLVDPDVAATTIWRSGNDWSMKDCPADHVITAICFGGGGNDCSGQRSKIVCTPVLGGLSNVNSVTMCREGSEDKDRFRTPETSEGYALTSCMLLPAQARLVIAIAECARPSWQTAMEARILTATMASVEGTTTSKGSRARSTRSDEGSRIVARDGGARERNVCSGASCRTRRRLHV